MMKKLAVAVFALTVTALGCGSDSGGGNKDAAVDNKAPGVEVQMDIPAQPGPEAGSLETQRDNKPAAIDGAVEKSAPDLGVDQQLIDAPPVDAPAIDGRPANLDGGAIDAPATDTRPAIDSGRLDGSTG